MTDMRGYSVANGGWRRDYERGSILVNPTQTALGTVQLGSSYVNLETGTRVSSVSLGPVSAFILKRP